MPSCTGSGRSKPYCFRSVSTCCFVAVSPATSAAGSAGMTCETTKVTTSTPSTVGTIQTMRSSVNARSFSGTSLHPGPAHVLAVAHRTEADVLHTLGVRPVPLRVVDEDAGRLVDDNAGRLLVRGLALGMIGRRGRAVEQRVDLRVLVP